MPRAGSRSYVCERRVWHSDMHQAMRGSLIREIFRVVHEIHSSATKKNKEWQEKLPVVVLKAEEIMYSKANSEAEYMDLKTLWDRTNDAINTIIKRDENTETGEFLQPCIEAALNLGCKPWRTLRSQRYSTQRSYLNTSCQEGENIVQGDHAINSQYIAYSVKPTTMNVTHLGSESQDPAVQNNTNSAAYRFPFASENVTSPEPRPGLGMLPQSHSRKVGVVEPAEVGVIQSLLSCDVHISNKITQVDVRDIPVKPHENVCDLSLRLAPLSVPCFSATNSDFQEIEDAGSTAQDWNKITDISPPIVEKVSFLPSSSGYDPLNSCSDKSNVQGECINIDAKMRKRKAVLWPYEDQHFGWQPKRLSAHLTRERS
ncbi:hypothetical protein SLE2022_035150 [Rubroshorea leprosula]